LNLATWTDRNLERFGDHDALVFEGRTYTSRALGELGARFAQGLIDLGVQPGDRVVVVLPNGPELVVAFPAILRAGAVIVLIHPGATAAEIERVAAHAEAKAILTSASLVGRAPAAPTVRIVVGRAAGWESFDMLCERSVPLAQPIARDDGDLAQIAYTSGTTGTPKGVVYTHATLTARLRYLGAQQSRGAPGAPMTFLSVLPMGHAFGMILLFNRLVLKTKIVCLPEFDPRAVLETIAREKIEYMPLVPAMAEALLASAELGKHDLSSLRSIAVGGAPVSVGLADRLEATFKFRPTVGYGMTELPGITFNTGVAKPGSVGRLIPGVQARILDAEGQELPPGQVGQIVLKAPWMSGVYYRQSADASTKVQEGWLHTGDLGYFDADKDLFIVGRSKEIIIQAGNNVYPHEVAEVVQRLAGVRECAVVGVPNEFLGEEVVACVVRSGELAPEAVIAHCRAALDPRKVPASVCFLDALPKTELGKVKVHLLREEILKQRSIVQETELVKQLRSTPAAERPELLRRAVEAKLRGILGAKEPLDVRAGFGDLGLDSLGAVELAHAVGDVLGRALPATLSFRHPSVEAVAAYALDELFGTEPAAVPSRRAPIAEREPIAVIGVGCRLPGGVDTPAALWSLLERGVDATAEITRWDMSAIYDPLRGTPGKSYTRRAALLDAPELFDAELFGLTPREARDLDPQHRLLLETSWEAFEHSGRDPLGQRGAHAGVFVGISGSSYGGGALGTSPAMAAGRISFFFDLDGPALAIDTACSSSLVALHGAVSALRRGECDLALAGGVNVMCAPEPFIGLSSIQALAPDGRCKAFDASADGFGRGEGCVMLALRRLSDAVADGDRVLGVVRGIALNHDGRSSSLTAPNGKAQEAVIRAALADAALPAGEVDYLEAHGTGTKLGDPIEIEAATTALGSKTRKLMVGSIKTNVGHLEAGAGVTGVLKLLLSFEHDTIPATLHQRELNPMLAPYASGFEVVAEARAWPRGQRPRRAAVTSLGMSGTNAHAILEEPPPRAPASPTDEDHAQLLVLSARSEAALQALAARYADRLADADAPPLADACYTAAVGRARLPQRACAVADDREGMVLRLRELAAGEAPTRRASATPKLGFVFTGQGSQHVGMGKRLYETQRSFRQALQRCAEILQPLLSRPLLDALFAEARPGELTLDDTALAQPALFALEWSLAELWRSLGIVPALVLGHSLGEYVAACVAGVIELPDALRLAAERGRLMQSLPRDGAMFALAADEATVTAAIGEEATRVSISGINGPRAVVLSGARASVERVVARLAERGVRGKPLKVSHAFHSPLMDPILDPFESLAAEVRFSAPRLGFVSTLTGRRASADELVASSYWRRQIRDAVRFSEAMATMAAEGAEIIVEVGPSPILLAMGQQCVTTPQAWLPSLRAGRDDCEQVLSSLGELFTRGVEPRWAGLWPEGRPKVVLPSYPFERQRHWTAGRAATRMPVAAATSATSAPRTPPRVALAQELAAAPREERVARLADQARAVLARVLGRTPASLAADANLLEGGLDSLRVMDFLGGLRQRVAVELLPADFMARPTIAAFAAFAADRLQPAPPSVAAAGPVITLNATGRRTPMFCMHPSGGEATAYLRLRGLLGDDQPLYAIQSRAAGAPDREHETIAAMASDYADLVQATRPEGPYVLAGWSMGGVTAQAVAVELERRGAPVERVVTIDSAVGAGPPGELQRISLALVGVLFEAQAASPPAMPHVDQKLREMFRLRVPEDRFHAYCEQHGLLVPGELSLQRFQAMMGLRFHHFSLVGAHVPGVLLAPMLALWAERVLSDWTPFAGGVTDTIVGGDHFTIMRPPIVERVAAALKERA
jgi:acyl transferase domain-containing protein/acyl-CoA synthetase (AMP-forming)/AMP-acid ligase II